MLFVFPEKSQKRSKFSSYKLSHAICNTAIVLKEKDKGNLVSPVKKEGWDSFQVSMPSIASVVKYLIM